MKFKNHIKNKDIIAMIHLRGMPGSPLNDLSPKGIIKQAIKEAKTYKRLGIKTVMIENMFDVPYTKDPKPEVLSIMSIIAYEIKKIGLFCGIQILKNGNLEALAVANAAGLDFIRAEGYLYSQISNGGFVDSCAAELQRFRRKIGAQDIMIFTDIKKKHASHAITGDVSIEETAHEAEFFLSDGIIITGVTTGVEPKIKDLQLKTELPIIIGSGMRASNIKRFKKHADLFIVGSEFKKDGHWQNELDENRIKRFIKAFNN